MIVSRRMEKCGNGGKTSRTAGMLGHLSGEILCGHYIIAIAQPYAQERQMSKIA